MSNLRLLHDQNIDGVALSQDLSQRAFNLQNSPHRRLAFTKDRLFMYSPIFLLRKKSMLTGIFDEQIVTLQETGLIEFWTEKYIDHRSINKKHREPSTLRIENIAAAFEICAAMHLISFIVFILEIFSMKYRCVKCFLDYLTY